MENTTFYHGFPIVGKKFALPSDTTDLDPKTKREVTICNLFINHKLSVLEITRVLDEDYGHIVNVLLNSRVVGERRQRNDDPPVGIERRRPQRRPATPGKKGHLEMLQRDAEH